MLVEGTFLEETIVPNCGYESANVASYKPWNEHSLKFSWNHFMNHFGSVSKQFIKTNRSFIFVFSIFLITIAALTVTGELLIKDSIFAIFVVIALILGLITRMVRKDLRLESLQIWFRDAYGLLVPYNEIVVALTNLYAGVESHQMSNGGKLVHVKNGLVYEPPKIGDHNHMPIENPV
jgi:hypothetical protein